MNISNIKIKKGSNGLYYSLEGNDDVFFDIHFPIIWAIRELRVKDFPQGTYPSNFEKDKKVTGALNCNDCKKKCSLNGVIVSYCIECLMCLISIGEKCGCVCMYDVSSIEYINKSGESECRSPCDRAECCFKTYLKDVNLWEIGDAEILKNSESNILIESEECLEIEKIYEEECVNIISESSTNISTISDNNLLDNLSVYDSFSENDSIPDLIDEEYESDSMVQLIEEDYNSDRDSGFYR